MEKGKLFVIEGACDGIGKTTQYILLKERLEKDGEKLTSHHFPTYNSYQGAPVEKYLGGELGHPSELSPYFINVLYATDRAITWHSHLKRLYEQGDTILLDRYTTSSLIYQTALIEDEKEKKDFIDYVVDFEYNKLGIKSPDKVIFFHAPFELVTEMRKKRIDYEGLDNDIHEKDLEYMKKVYENSMFVADYLAWDKIKCNIGNKMRSIDDIHEEVYRKIRAK